MSKIHWLSETINSIDTYIKVDEQTRKGFLPPNYYVERLETAILDTIKSKLPEEMKEKRFAEMYEGQARDYSYHMKGWNECLKAVKESLLGEK